MVKLEKSLSKLFILLIVFAFLSFPGCKGSDTREKVDDTVEELAGKKKVDQMKKMESQVKDITDKQTERMKDLLESD